MSLNQKALGVNRSGAFWFSYQDFFIVSYTKRPLSVSCGEGAFGVQVCAKCDAGSLWKKRP